MTDAPERIWAKLDRASVDGSGAARLLAMDRPFGEYRGDPATPYVRADIFDALQAENDRLRGALDYELIHNAILDAHDMDASPYSYAVSVHRAILDALAATAPGS
jgi:hypothetical protein